MVVLKKAIPSIIGLQKSHTPKLYLNTAYEESILPATYNFVCSIVN